MEYQDVEALFDKYRRGETTEVENALIESWYLNEIDRSVPFEGQMDYENREQRIWGKIQEQKQQLRKVRLWPRVAGAAAAIAAITLGVWLYEIASSRNSSRNDEVVMDKVVINDIAPGRNIVTLTLPNGKTINLSDAKTGVVIGNDKLAYNDGSTIANLSPSGRDGVAREGSNNKNPLSPQGGSLPEGERSRVQMLTASTPRGGTYQVTLPDGTKVWLNAASSLKFPSTFARLVNRKVELRGEAYFEVTKNKQQPFIVKTAEQEVEVLGTHFNINSYADEGSTKTTLLEGAVKVAFLSPSGRDGVAREGNTNNSNPLSLKGSLPGGERSIVLKPGQQSVLTGSNQIMVKQVDAEELIAWKDGKFVFNREDIKTIMRKIERWYDVEVVYQDNVGDLPFSGTISRRENVSKLLNVLQKTGMLRYQIDGRKIILSKK